AAPQLVEFVPGVPEDRLLLSEKRARGNGTVPEVESLVRILLRVAVVAEGQSPALDPKVGEVRRCDRSIAVRQGFVDQVDHGNLVPARAISRGGPVEE